MRNPDPSDEQIVKAILDTASGATILATIMGYLPAIAAIMGILWYGIQIWESATVQSFLHKKAKPNEKLPPSSE